MRRRKTIWEEFRRVRDAAIRPVFRDFADYIKRHGWETGIKAVGGASAGFEDALPSGSDPEICLYFLGYGEARMDASPPTFRIGCDLRSGKIWFRQTALYGVDDPLARHEGPPSPGEVTVDFVQEKLVNFFRQLVLSEARWEAEWGEP